MASQTRAPTSDFATGGSVSYSSGSTGYTLVNDHPDTADPLTSYVNFGTANNSFIVFGFSPFTVPSGRTISSVVINYTDEEPSFGSNSAAGRLRVGGTYYDASTHNPSTTTTSRTDTWTTNPRTSAAWTVADVNGTGSNPLEYFGVIGPDSSPAWRLGSIEIVVNFSDPVTQTGASALSSSSTLASIGSILLGGALALSSVGSLTASGIVPQPQDGFRETETTDFRITEAGHFRVTERFYDAEASLSASGIVSPTAEVIANVTLFGESALTGSGTITSLGNRTTTGSYSATGTGTLTSVGLRNTFGNSVLDVTSTLTSFANVSKNSFSNLLSVGSLSTAPLLTLKGASSLSSTGSSIFAGINLKQGLCQVVGTGTLVCSGEVSKQSSTSLNAVGTLVSQEFLKLNGQTSLISQGTLSALGTTPSEEASSSLSASSTLGVQMSLLAYGQVESILINYDRETEEEDLRLTEDDNQRITEDTFSNIITSGAIFNSTLIPFSSRAYVNVNGIWKEFTPYVKYEGTWVAPEKTYRKENGMWKRIY